MSLNDLIQSVSDKQDLVAQLQQLQSVELTDSELTQLQSALQSQDVSIDTISQISSEIIRTHSSTHSDVERAGFTIIGFLTFVVAIVLTILMYRFVTNALDKSEDAPTSILEESTDLNGEWRQMLDGN